MASPRFIDRADKASLVYEIRCLDPFICHFVNQSAGVEWPVACHRCAPFHLKGALELRGGGVLICEGATLHQNGDLSISTTEVAGSLAIVVSGCFSSGPLPVGVALRITSGLALSLHVAFQITVDLAFGFHVAFRIAVGFNIALGLHVAFRITVGLHVAFQITLGFNVAFRITVDLAFGFHIAFRITVGFNVAFRTTLGLALGFHVALWITVGFNVALGSPSASTSPSRSPSASPSASTPSVPEVVPVPNLTAVLNTEEPGVVFGNGAQLLSTSVAGSSVAGAELEVATTTTAANTTVGGLPAVTFVTTFSVALFGPTQLERTITVTAELDPDDARRVVFSFGFPYFAVGPLTYDSTVFVGTVKTTAAGDGDGDGGLSPALAAAIAVPAVLGGLVVVSLAVALIVCQRKRVRPQPVRPRRGPKSKREKLCVDKK
ncbi:uncharacterized protein ACA1_208360 [Acanthamoeba castellanii str. Neff]|uniref:Uncharacterized protein n=1 Tax=Acanthamoeba castellanii (strain ATCC 30010 / Neff) TaxID=1257118 RepID=L8GZK4_ACACF|nr:uncharacterized protein ACA1_208360 [Acanthamoeba castellanii str. Neff]ELR17958.1 hypothetical protein ACA1_208360 [Acanthamoeba castellanii str. Neff]